MHLEYQLSEQEYKDFSYYTGWSSPERKLDRIKYYYLNTVIYLAILAILFLVSAKSLHTSPIESVAIVVGISILVIVFLTIRIKVVFARAVEKQLNESGREKLLGSKKVDINESGIKISMSDIESDFKWTAISRNAVVNDCYYLYITSVQAIIVPKRAFSSVEERNEFERLLVQYMPLNAGSNT